MVIKGNYVVVGYPTQGDPSWFKGLLYFSPTLEDAKDYIYQVQPDYRDCPTIYDGQSTWAIGIFKIYQAEFEDRRE